MDGVDSGFAHIGYSQLNLLKAGRRAECGDYGRKGDVIRYQKLTVESDARSCGSKGGLSR